MRQTEEPSCSTDVRRRLAWLLACIGTGVIVGWVGSSLTGSDNWYLAIPVAVAVGWLFFADPSRCEPPR
ncbi:MAG TPA: hypothetical protein VFF26_07115 [Gallionella sp.]|nr:hypothetical protein [Gallionella sp.]